MIRIGVSVNSFSASGGGASFDADAQAFFDRVTTAGGTLSTTEKNATNQLVLDMKSAGIWTSMKAVYPMVGASAAACAQNLKSASFTGTFTSGWTFSSTGVTPNGSSAYMSTGLTPSANLSLNNASISVYLRTNSIGLRCDISVIQDGVAGANDQFNIYPRFNDEAYFRVFDGSSATVANTNSQGWYLANRVSSAGTRNFKNSTLTTKTVASGTINTSQIILGAGGNATGTAAAFSDRQNAFASIGDGLTDTQASNFYTAVQTFNQTLNRQVGAQIVSDADAQAYIDRVYTAGGTLTNTEANAVNQLTIDMKAAGIWSAMKAVYPMVGSSAAACAQNLKSSSYTGTFSSGWTFASTGATPNGTSAYFDTNLNQSGNLTPSNNHISVYSRTNFNGSTGFSPMDCGITNNTSYSFQIISPRSNDLALYENGTHSISVSNTNSQGLFIGTSTSSTSAKFYKNGSSIGTSTATQTRTMFSNNVYFGASNVSTSNTAFYFSPRENAFASIGDGLTDTQATALYNAVQTFNTTLSRQV